MDAEVATCPRCHTSVRATDYFCFNCGKNLKPAPPSLSLTGLVILFLKSTLLPPLGLWYMLPYLRQKDVKFKAVGVVVFVWTIVVLVAATVWTRNFMNELSNQVNQAMGAYTF